MMSPISQAELTGIFTLAPYGLHAMSIRSSLRRQGRVISYVYGKKERDRHGGLRLTPHCKQTALVRSRLKRDSPNAVPMCTFRRANPPGTRPSFP